jgi:hypothetical protein
VQRKMAAGFRGDAKRMRTAAVEKTARVLGFRMDDWTEVELAVLSDFAVVLDLVSDLNRWSDGERQSLLQIIRAKSRSDEGRYLKLMQGHVRLRTAMIKLGSMPIPGMQAT